MKPAGAKIDAQTMAAALSWEPYLVAHERYVAALAGEDPAVEIGEKFLAWLTRNPVENSDDDDSETHSRRDIYNAVRGGQVQRVEDIDAALELLEECGWIRSLGVPERPGPGRKPSPRFAVHPDAARKYSTRPQNTQNAQNGRAEGDSADTAYSAGEKDVDEQPSADEGERF
jgi:hypothetical protein